MFGIDKNVGSYDRIVRGVIGVLALAVGVAALTGMLGSGTVGTAGGVVALVVAAAMLFSAATQRCVGYKLIGVSTCDMKTNS
jgi:hypothetical protein